MYFALLTHFYKRVSDGSYQFDYFHELVITQEFVRAGARGYGDGLLGGMVIGMRHYV